MTTNSTDAFRQFFSTELERRGVDENTPEGKRIANTALAKIKEQFGKSVTRIGVRNILDEIAGKPSDTQPMDIELSEAETTETGPKQDSDAPGKASPSPAERFK